jgi:hypothetical protein
MAHCLYVRACACGEPVGFWTPAFLVLQYSIATHSLTHSLTHFQVSLLYPTLSVQTLQIIPMASAVQNDFLYEHLLHVFNLSSFNFWLTDSWCLYCSDYLLTHLLTLLLSLLLSLLLTHLLTLLLTYLLTHLLTLTLAHSYSLTHYYSLAYSLTYSLTITYSLTYTYWLTYLQLLSLTITHLLTHSLFRQRQKSKSVNSRKPFPYSTKRAMGRWIRVFWVICCAQLDRSGHPLFSCLYSIWYFLSSLSIP